MCSELLHFEGAEAAVLPHAHLRCLLITGGTVQCACVLQGTPSLEELKLQYYHLLIRYHINANNYIDACRCYRAVYESDSIKDDKEKWVPVRIKLYEAGL